MSDVRLVVIVVLSTFLFAFFSAAVMYTMLEFRRKRVEDRIQEKLHGLFESARIESEQRQDVN